MIEAITFDFWDTIAIDDSDEPKRAAMGLPGKVESRIQLFAARITQNYPHISYAQAAAAYQHANQNFSDEWHSQHRTPGVASRLYDAYDYLGLRPEPGKFAGLMREVDELVREIEDMEVRIPPDFAPGIHGTLELLQQQYKLGIISDTIHTTGRGLRYLLQRHGLLQYFSHFIFSDEVGASKPAAKVFRQAALGMHTAPNEMVHIGDRESNDVAGPLAIGMKAILFTGIKDRGSEKSRANAICRSYAELPDLLRRLPVYTPPVFQPINRYPSYL
ncbi:MAG: HAD family hydrolase [Caldilineaceae bacterium]|nr:HAD family hydrolase [Caldilineaceae bacterium]